MCVVVIVSVMMVVIMVMAVMLRAALFGHSARFGMTRCHGFDCGAEKVGLGWQLPGQKPCKPRQCNGLRG